MEFKDFVQMGAGALIIAKEKVEKELEGLVEKGKMSRQEMEGTMERFKERGAQEEEDLKSKIKEIVQEVMSEMNIATRQDIDNLRDELKKS